MPLKLQPNIITVVQRVFQPDPTQIQFHPPPEKEEPTNIQEKWEKNIVKFNYSAKSVSMFFLSNVPESLVARMPEEENLIIVFTFMVRVFNLHKNKLLMVNYRVSI